MLTAETKNGKKICLGFDFQKEVLQELRNQEEFICPECGESVILKLGEKRIFHFAHKSNVLCHDSYEHESDDHMDGKRQLFQWLIGQGVTAELEYYVKEIQQRPDIMFIFNGNKYALEYQCSTIPETVFIKRTNSYIENGYIPLWILGRNHIHEKKHDMMELSNFHYLFLRNTSDGSFFIPVYDPVNKYFRFIGSIHSFSAKNTFVQNRFFSPKNLLLENVLDPKINQRMINNRWYFETEKYFLHWSMHPSPLQKRFLHEIYTRNLNPYLLPTEIGLPVHHSFLIHTSPIIWQTYLYLDILAKRYHGQFFHISEVERSFNWRIAKNEISIRILPQLKKLSPFTAVVDYLIQLKKMGYLETNNNGVYQVKKEFSVPKSNREKEENKQLFFENYRRIWQINK